MKRLLIAVFIVVMMLSVSGCIRIKGPNCPPGDVTGVGIGGATSIIPDVEVSERTSEGVNEEVSEETSGLPQKVVMEGELVNFPNLEATDPDGDTISYTFTEPLDSTGEWLTTVGDAGEYTITITASDGKNEVKQDILLIIKASNVAPVITLSDIVVNEGDVVDIQPEVNDEDGDDVEIRFTGWQTEFPYTTTFEDAGTYTVTVFATDGKDTVEHDVQVIVQNVNRPPTIEAVEDVVIKEFDEITLKPKVEDPDGDPITLTYTEPITGSGVWQTAKGDAGEYEVTITASDGTDFVSTTFSITVQPFNEPPVLSVSDVTVQEGDTVQLNVEAADPEGEEVVVLISGWMNSDTKEVSYGDEGVHEVLITASDGENTVEVIITVTVEDVNRAPVFGSGAFD